MTDYLRLSGEDSTPPALDAGVDVIVDLTRCEFIDGACVRELLLAEARPRRSERRLVLISEPTRSPFSSCA